MYQLEETYYFYFLALIPLVLAAFFFYQMWRKKAQKRFATPDAFKRLSPSYSGSKSFLKVILLCLTIAALVIALVNPKIGTRMEEVKREGVDIVFAIDVSKSMLAEDVAPNRLEKSKQLVNQIISQLGGDRVGIIGYAGSAFPQLPLTTDFNAARMFLDAMNTDMVSSQGTAIGEAISLARTFYKDEEEDGTNKVLVIISDGEDHAGEAVAMAEEAAREGFRIFTVGVGTPSGGPIPIKRDGILLEYKRDQANERVITKLDASTLEEIAAKGNGNYVHGLNTTEVVENLNSLLNKLDKQEFDSMEYAGFKDQFQWFLAAAIFFLLLDILVLEKKTRWLQKLNLFNEKKNA